jgi:hypothetical protein
MQICMDVDTALAEVPVNILPLIDDTDFKTIEDAVVFNQAGLALFWNFVTTAGVQTCTAVTPTSAGDYDWTDQGASGMYAIEIPASGGASINNDTEGFGWFTGVATGILPWRGPVICFRAAALNNSLVDAGTTGLLAPTVAARTLDVTATGAAGIDWANVENPTTAVDLSGTNIDVDQVVASVSGAVGSVTGAVGSVTGAVGSVTGNVGGNVVGDVQGNVDGSVASVSGNIGGLAAGAITDVENAVWDATLASHVAAGSTGEALSNASSAGDPWATALPGAYGAGTAGFILGTNLDALVSSRLAPTVAARTLDVSVAGNAGIDWANVENPTTALNLSGTNIDVDQVVASVSGAVGSVTGAVGSVTGNVGGNVTGSVRIVCSRRDRRCGTCRRCRCRDCRWGLGRAHRRASDGREYRPRAQQRQQCRRSVGDSTPRSIWGWHGGKPTRSCAGRGGWRGWWVVHRREQCSDIHRYGTDSQRDRQYHRQS